MRDARRSDAYAAEDAAFEGTVVAEAPGGPALEGAIETVLASAWWRVHVGDPAIVRGVRVRTARDSHWAPATGTLAVDPAEPWYVVTHELAHVAVTLSMTTATGPPDIEPHHGPRWRAWNVALAGAAFGEPFAALLVAACDRYGLPADPRPAPPPAAPLLTIATTTARRGGWRPPR